MAVETPLYDTMHNEWERVRKSAYQRGAIEAYTYALTQLKRIARPSAPLREQIAHLETVLDAATKNG